MRSTCTLLALFYVGCASAPPPPPAPAAPTVPTYAIQLHRPVAIGDTRKRTTTLSSTQSWVVKSEDSLLKQQLDEVHVTLTAVEKVLDIDDHGIATKTELTIEEAFSETEAGRVDLLAPGAVLVVTRGVEAPFALEAGSLTPEVEKLLAMVFTTTKPSRTDDDVFGSTEPQPVGGAWSIRADTAAQDLTEAGFAIEASALSGETVLEAVEAVGNVECLQIAAHMKATDLIPPGLKSGDTIEMALLEASFRGAFPTDAGRPRLNDRSELSAELTVLRTVSERPVRTELRMKRTRETIYAEVAAGS